MHARGPMAILASLLGALLPGLASAAGTYPPDAVDRLAAAGRANLVAYLEGHPPPHNCTLATAARRFEWSDLTPAQRRAYIAAVQCLQTRPPRSDPAQVPGARSRFDDFVAVHIERSGSIHATANFLTWHRYFTWAYEQALRDECGYTGYQPYWNWDRYAADPSQSPLFDGSATSMSGDGVYSAYPGLLLPLYPPPYNVIPPDAGGGCVTTGPFANMTVNLGPVFAGLPDVPANPRPDGLGHNPRCLRRDLNCHAAAQTTADRTAALVRDSAALAEFQDTMNGRADRGDWGVHTSGHFTIGGDPGGDFFVSPGDPAFYLHHAMIDRVYWTWQLRGLPGRLAEVAGTLTPANSPPSRPGARDDPLDLGVLAPAATLGDALDTLGGLGGRFCYVYD